MRRLDFVPTEAVQTSRRRDQYIPCPACGSQSQRYLFHRTGVRFVRCRACDLVFVDPVDPHDRAYFDVGALGEHDDGVDRRNVVNDFVVIMERVVADYEQRFGRSPRRVLLAGRWHPEFVAAVEHRVDLVLASSRVNDETALVTEPLVESFAGSLGDFDVILLHEFLEAAHEPARVLDRLAEQMCPDAIVAVTFANMKSMPSRFLRRRWRGFFEKKIAFYNAENLEGLMWRAGFSRQGSERLKGTFSFGYVARRLEFSRAARRLLSRSGLARAAVRVASGREVIFFSPVPNETVERLSIIVPVYNEERYVGDVLAALLAKDLHIEREIIVVESNSTDGSRDIVSKFESEPGLRVIYEERARGKGHAVRAGLAQATGTIILIQDADFEYDLDDYDALLEAIVQRRTSFVLGSRSLGLDDWKVRRYPSSRVKGLLMNLAQVMFARSFNALYQQNVTDINTMLKVFRRECIDGCHLTGDGFNFDIELVCKIVRNGFEPLEVPVNYVARGFDEGKKINFLLDAYPSYYQLFRCRFGRI
jgi:hypothetical protein